MKAGKTASVSLLLALSAIVVGVPFAAARITWFDSMTPTGRIFAEAGVMAALIAAILIPMGIMLDRSLTRLCSYIDASDSEEAGPTYSGPKWLQPVTRAFTGAVDRHKQRESSLSAQLRDLDIRHRVSEAERRQTEAVLNSLRDAVIVTDAFDEIVMVNQGAAEILGFNPSDAIHKPVDKMIGDEHLCRLISDARGHANFNERRLVEHEVEVVGENGDSESRVFEVSMACVENHKSEVGGVIAVLHDLSRERELSQMKSDFVSKASHELRTPLSSIRAYVEMLVDGEAEDTEAAQEFYQIIQNETDRLGRLIDNMLNISRIEAGIVQIDREQVDIKSLIVRAVDTIEPQAREKDISLHKKMSDIDLRVEGDPDMLFQVILNLMSNAVKYTPEGGRVTVSADSDNLTRSVLLAVTDTGLGIPEDAMPKLFDKFFRVENYKRVAKGTGLGLSLCQHIVESLHKGQIGVESQVGMGSKFWVTIPMEYAGQAAA